MKNTRFTILLGLSLFVTINLFAQTNNTPTDTIRQVTTEQLAIIPDSDQDNTEKP